MRPVATFSVCVFARSQDAITTGLLPTVSGIQRVPKPSDSIRCAVFAASEEVSPSKKYQTPNFPVSKVDSTNI
jgi:hypothetical protein